MAALRGRYGELAATGTVRMPGVGRVFDEVNERTYVRYGSRMTKGSHHSRKQERHVALGRVP